MKIITSLGFAVFLAAIGNTEAFGPAKPLNGAVANGSNGMTMRISIGDKKRQSRILRIIDSNPSKETVETELLSEFTANELSLCNWKVRTVLKRKIRNQATKHELPFDSSFGEP